MSETEETTTSDPIFWQTPGQRMRAQIAKSRPPSPFLTQVEEYQFVTTVLGPEFAEAERRKITTGSEEAIIIQSTDTVAAVFLHHVIVRSTVRGELRVAKEDVIAVNMYRSNWPDIDHERSGTGRFRGMMQVGVTNHAWQPHRDSGSKVSLDPDGTATINDVEVPIERAFAIRLIAIAPITCVARCGDGEERKVCSVAASDVQLYSRDLPGELFLTDNTIGKDGMAHMIDDLNSILLSAGYATTGIPLSTG